MGGKGPGLRSVRTAGVCLTSLTSGKSDAKLCCVSFMRVKVRIAKDIHVVDSCR